MMISGHEYAEHEYVAIRGGDVLIRLPQYPEKDAKFARRARRKRAFDLAFSVMTAPIWLLLMLVCCVLIKIESPSDPVFFKQVRTGLDGRRFHMLKLRTMVARADEMKEQYRHMNKLKWPDFKLDHDPRITKVGRFLRRMHLDELPQMFNVLRGDMSLVGPRPTSFGSETYAAWQIERLSVRPGITGLWQVFRNGNEEFDQRVKLDLLYIEKQGILLDLAILIVTVFVIVFRQPGR